MLKAKVIIQEQEKFKNKEYTKEMQYVSLIIRI